MITVTRRARPVHHELSKRAENRSNRIAPSRARWIGGRRPFVARNGTETMDSTLAAEPHVAPPPREFGPCPGPSPARPPVHTSTPPYVHTSTPPHLRRHPSRQTVDSMGLKLSACGLVIVYIYFSLQWQGMRKVRNPGRTGGTVCSSGETAGPGCPSGRRPAASRSDHAATVRPPASGAGSRSRIRLSPTPAVTLPVGLFHVKHFVV